MPNCFLWSMFKQIYSKYSRKNWMTNRLRDFVWLLGTHMIASIAWWLQSSHPVAFSIMFLFKLFSTQCMIHEHVLSTFNLHWLTLCTLWHLCACSKAGIAGIEKSVGQKNTVVYVSSSQSMNRLKSRPIHFHIILMILTPFLLTG